MNKTENITLNNLQSNKKYQIINQKIRDIVQQYCKKDIKFGGPVFKFNAPPEIKETYENLKTQQKKLYDEILEKSIEQEKKEETKLKQQKENNFNKDANRLRQILLKYNFKNAARDKNEHVIFNGDSGNLILNQSGHRPFLALLKDEGNSGIFGIHVDIKDLKKIKKFTENLQLNCK